MVLGCTEGGLDTGGSRGYSDRWLGEYIRGLGLSDEMDGRVECTTVATTPRGLPSCNLGGQFQFDTQ